MPQLISECINDQFSVLFLPPVSVSSHGCLFISVSLIGEADLADPHLDVLWECKLKARRMSGWLVATHQGHHRWPGFALRGRALGVSILVWFLLGQSSALEKTSVICLDVCACVCTCVHTSVSDQKRARDTGGLPCWLSSRESDASAGDGGSIPGMRRSHMPWSNSAWASQLLSLCSRVQEPQLLKPECPWAWAAQPEKPLPGEVLTLQLESPPLTTTGEKPSQQRRPSAASK